MRVCNAKVVFFISSHIQIISISCWQDLGSASRDSNHVPPPPWVPRGSQRLPLPGLWRRPPSECLCLCPCFSLAGSLKNCGMVPYKCQTMSHLPPQNPRTGFISSRVQVVTMTVTWGPRSPVPISSLTPPCTGSSWGYSTPVPSRFKLESDLHRGVKENSTEGTFAEKPGATKGVALWVAEEGWLQTHKATPSVAPGFSANVAWMGLPRPPDLNQTPVLFPSHYCFPIWRTRHHPSLFLYFLTGM